MHVSDVMEVLGTLIEVYSDYSPSNIRHIYIIMYIFMDYYSPYVHMRASIWLEKEFGYVTPFLIIILMNIRKSEPM